MHLLVIPERHVDTFREIDEFAPARRSGCSSSSPRPRATPGSTDYRVQCQRRPGGGQTVFHLHWHMLGARTSATCSADDGDGAVTLIEELEDEVKEAMLARTRTAATRCA